MTQQIRVTSYTSQGTPYGGRVVEVDGIQYFFGGRSVWLWRDGHIIDFVENVRGGRVEIEAV